jgi:hypothetical protein
MAAGYTVTRIDLDNLMGRLVQSLVVDLTNIVAFKAKLDDTSLFTDAVLQAAPLNYTSGDTTQIRAAFTDLAKLRDISYAAATQSSANDFWFNAKHLTGISLPY